MRPRAMKLAQTLEPEAPKEPYDISSAVMLLEKRVASLELQTHTEHTIGQETLNTIALHVIRQLTHRLQQLLGDAPQEEKE